MFDEYGPEKILEVYNAKVGMRGFVIIDNLSLGPGKGGIRMTPTISKEEVFRLARTMTWKNSLAGLPFGGAKSGIIADPRNFDLKQKKIIVEAFSEELKTVSPREYIAAPDINMGKQEMEWFAKKNGDKRSCTGKPKKMGGLPHELGSTGFGVYHAALVATPYVKIDLNKCTVAIEGFGNVGWFAGKFLSEQGSKIIAVSDSRGVIYNNRGLNFKKLDETKKKKGSVTEYGDGVVLPNEKILDIKADVLVTAAVPDLIKEKDVDRLNFKMIVEGSNIAMNDSTEELCYRRKILVVPDFVANAGGVISSYVEYINGKEKEMFEMVKKKISTNTKIVLDNSFKNNIKPRDSAMEIAVARVLKKCKICKVQ